MALTTKFLAQIQAILTGSGDHGTPRATLELSHSVELASGVASGLADKVFSDQRSIEASSNDDLDLAGGVTDAFGAAITFAKVKAILIKAAAANVNNVVVGAAASNPFVGPFGGTAPTIALPPGGSLLLTAPVGGWSLTGGASDVLRIANSGSGTAVTYDIMVIGTSS